MPVLLDKSVEGLDIRKGGVYVDVTFGGGGHSREIYNKLSAGKLIAFDQDPDARQNAEGFGSDEDRSFIFVASNFRHLKKYLKFHKVEEVDGLLADLGVSSHQFDEAERGFSTRYDGKLNMRMDRNDSHTAKEIINGYTEDDLIHIFSFYGEIRNARTLARKIVESRENRSIETTAELKAIAGQVAPKARLEKYLARLFQAVRIEVNEEFEALKELLGQCSDCLRSGGRLVVISYHSLEDRLVKNFMNTGNFKGEHEKDFYGNLIRPFNPINRKPVTPDENEVAINKRARSAKLRIAEKT